MAKRKPVKVLPVTREQVENELVQELQKYGTKTFSYKNKDEFIQYLDEIEKNASASHIAKVEEVYGEGHVNPYMTIFKNTEV